MLGQTAEIFSVIYGVLSTLPYGNGEQSQMRCVTRPRHWPIAPTEFSPRKLWIYRAMNNTMTGVARDHSMTDLVMV